MSSTRLPKTNVPKLPPVELDRVLINLISLFVQDYMETGKIPTAERLHAEYGISTDLVEAALATETFREALAERGINFDRQRKDWIGKTLGPQQLIVANAMLDLVDTRSQKKKLQDLGISTAQYQAWLRDPIFRSYLQQRAEDALGDNQHEAHSALLDKVRMGDIKAIAYYNELTGRFKPQTAAQASQVDIQQIIVRIIEIVDKRVTNNDEKLLIANDLRQIISRQQVAVELSQMNALPVESVLIVDEAV